MDVAGGFDSACDRILVRYVANDSFNAVRNAFAVEINANNAGTFGHRFEGRRLSDTRGGTGYQYGLAVKSHDQCTNPISGIDSEAFWNRPIESAWISTAVRLSEPSSSGSRSKWP